MRNLEAINTEDAVIAGVLLAADTACGRWAEAIPTLDGPVLIPHGSIVEHPVTWLVVRQGIWRIVLVRHDGLPRGTQWLTQQRLLAAFTDGDMAGLGPSDVDHIVQVGLFGEVRY